jgi:hypothetical protein
MATFKSIASQLVASPGLRVAAKKGFLRDGGTAELIAESCGGDLQTAKRMVESLSQLGEFELTKKDGRNYIELINKFEGKVQRSSAFFMSEIISAGFASSIEYWDDAEKKTKTRTAAGTVIDYRQCDFLDAVNQQRDGIRLLFTTWQLKGTTVCLATLAQSYAAYERGYMMNPSILAQMGATSSQGCMGGWHTDINASFIESGARQNTTFVFVTSPITFETFFDSFLKDRTKLAPSMAMDIGARSASGCSWSWANYPVKPGGIEVYTLLKLGYVLDEELTKKAMKVKMGFVLRATGRKAGSGMDFTQNYKKFTQDQWDILNNFMSELRLMGVC